MKLYPLLFSVLTGLLFISPVHAEQPISNQTESPDQYGRATFAGGCFWCMEPPFDKLDGVISTTSGYTGGHQKNPTYQEVSAGGTGHTESVQVVYDPKRVSYEELLKVFWRNIDPTVRDAQFCDHGQQYRTAIFYHDDKQRELAERSKEALDKTKPFKEPIVTEITPANIFYPAEDYHQDFYKKNPVRYKFYRYNCGRDQRLEQLWGDAHQQK
ncbi:MAG: peptide-methionine (S)-S-oxide reductase MsrA [Gammaproteobacteria bacterium]|nr:peptide-methionine (S)-S-oxide reductase MsrA [Gammaproteobacteria bacterium]